MEAASEGAVDFLAMVADLEAESERRDADSKMSVEAQTAAMDGASTSAPASLGPHHQPRLGLGRGQGEGGGG
jgi:hypothetical protein